MRSMPCTKVVGAGGQDSDCLSVLCRKVSAAVKNAWTAPLFGTPAAVLGKEAAGILRQAIANQPEQQFFVGDCCQHAAEISKLEVCFSSDRSGEDALFSGAPGTPLPEPAEPAMQESGPSTPCELSDNEEPDAPMASQAGGEGGGDDNRPVEVTPGKDSPSSRHLPPCWLLFPAPSPLPLPQSPPLEKRPVVGKTGAAVLAVRCGGVSRSPRK
ncbi:hypothetical protein N2152v2_009339 [Parachlorella kessleri]